MIALLVRLLEQPFVDRLGWALLHFVWQGIALLAAAELLLALLKRHSASARYLAALGSLAILAACPLVTFALLSDSDRSAPTIASSPTAVETPAPSLDNAAAVLEPLPSYDDAPSLTEAPEPSPVSMPSEAAPVEALAVTETAIADEATVVAPASTSVTGAEFWNSQWRADLLPCFVAIWLAGVVIMSARLLVAWACAERLKSRGGSPMSEEWASVLNRLCQRMGIRHPVRLLQSPLVSMPSVVGWIRPVILFPLAGMTGLTPVQLEAILAHELAHIRRHDYLVNLVQNLVETLLFYHPAVWRLSGRIRVERENCCDDLAVAMSLDRVAYARALFQLAEKEVVASEIALAVNGGDLAARVRRLLNLPPATTTTLSPLVGGGLLVTLIGGLLLGLSSASPTAAAPSDPTIALAAKSHDLSMQIDEPALVLEVTATRTVPVPSRPSGSADDSGREELVPIPLTPVTGSPGEMNPPVLLSKKRVRLEFNDKPWLEVVSWLAEESGRPVVADSLPTESFTYTGPKWLTVCEALQRIDFSLARQGYRLRLRRETLEVLPADVLARELAELYRRRLKESGKNFCDNLEILDVRFVKESEGSGPQPPAFAYTMKATGDITGRTIEGVLQCAFPRLRLCRGSGETVIAHGFAIHRDGKWLGARAIDLKAGEQFDVWENLGQEWNATRVGSLFPLAAASRKAK